MSTTLVVVIFIIGAIMIFDTIFGESDSTPVLSDDTISPTELYVQTLQELSSRKQPSFCTFEFLEDKTIWFQVSEKDLTIGNCSWPKSDKTVLQMLNESDIKLPSNFNQTDDELYDSRVITFECNQMSLTEWANFIDQVMRKIHNLPDNYRIKGWVTKAE